MKDKLIELDVELARVRMRLFGINQTLMKSSIFSNQFSKTTFLNQINMISELLRLMQEQVLNSVKYLNGESNIPVIDEKYSKELKDQFNSIIDKWMGD